MNSKNISYSGLDITEWLDNAGRFARLPATSINKIAKQIQALPEDSAKRRSLVNKLVNHNLLLVASFVKRFMDSKSHNKWGSAETVDYLQVGAIGLMRAADKFDPERGYTFSTYATHWIRSAVGRYNLKTMTPVHVSESAARRYLYYKRNGKISRNGITREAKSGEIQLLEMELSNAYGYLSLDMPLTDDGGTLLDVIPSRGRMNTPSWKHVYNSLRQAGINPIQIQVLKDYYVDGLTIAEISSRIGVSQNDIRKYKREAMALTGRRASDMGW